MLSARVTPNMVDLDTTLPSLQVLVWITLIPVAPLIGLVLSWALGGGKRQRSRDGEADDPRRSVLVASFAVSFGLAIVAVWHLLEPNAPSALLSGALGLWRGGLLDWSFSNTGDGIALPLVLVTSLVGMRLLARAPLKHPARVAFAVVALVGVIWSAMADTAIGVVCAWSSTGMAVAGLTAVDDGLDGRAIALDALAWAAIAAASVVLYWAGGGSIAQDGFVSDFEARYAVVREGHSSDPASGGAAEESASAATGRPTISFLSTPGAELYLDGARTPESASEEGGSPLLAPFVAHPVQPGMHTLRVHPGFGLRDHVIKYVNVEPGAALRIVPIGSVASARELDESLRVSATEGRQARLERIAERELGGRGNALTTATLLLVLGVMARARAAWRWAGAPGARPGGDWGRPVAFTAGVIPTSALLARHAFVLAESVVVRHLALGVAAALGVIVWLAARREAGGLGRRTWIHIGLGWLLLLVWSRTAVLAPWIGATLVLATLVESSVQPSHKSPAFRALRACARMLVAGGPLPMGGVSLALVHVASADVADTMDANLTRATLVWLIVAFGSAAWLAESPVRERSSKSAPGIDTVRATAWLVLLATVAWAFITLWAAFVPDVLASLRTRSFAVTLAARRLGELDWIWGAALVVAPTLVAWWLGRHAPAAAGSLADTSESSDARAERWGALLRSFDRVVMVSVSAPLAWIGLLVLPARGAAQRGRAVAWAGVVLAAVVVVWAFFSAVHT